ncbi:Uncharacterised protein [Yersinia frederiksenii]|nr:Uncharacterised protein [Yersinia frederiksenii]
MHKARLTIQRLGKHLYKTPGESPFLAQMQRDANDKQP